MYSHIQIGARGRYLLANFADERSCGFKRRALVVFLVAKVELREGGHER